MAATYYVFDYLEDPPPPAPVQVIFGDEPFLKRLVIQRMRALAAPDDDLPVATFDGTAVAWRDVHDELCTVSLFNRSGLRVALVEDADKFVTEYRRKLEDYVGQPQSQGLLILEVSKWASNTKLYKLVDQHGLQVECRQPQVSQGKQKVLDQARMVRWLVDWGQQRHRVQLAKNAAVLLLDIIGPEFGLLDQELAKLALYADKTGKVSEKLVHEVGGGWRAKTAWEVLDAALAGNSAEAIAQLDRLLLSGEHPNALFGPISWSLRRFAAATRIYQRAERQRRRMRLPEALEQAGFFKWQREAMRAAEQQMKQMGRERAGQLNQWLLATDLALKGTHSSPDMARLTLEQLIFRLDKQFAPKRPGS